MEPGKLRCRLGVYLVYPITVKMCYQNLYMVNYVFVQAISVTSAINDRICIKSKKNITAFYSPQKLLSCCDDCGDGCNGGYSGTAWQYWMKKGLVTGGDYGSNEVI